MLQLKDERRHFVAPILLLAAVMIAVVPWLHPNNTCKDWLEKWGQLADAPLWLPIHQLAMAGSALAAVGTLLLALLGPPTVSGFLGGAGLAIGYGIQTMLALIHASAVSSLGRAFNAAAGDTARRQAIRTTAEAFVAYDVACSGVAAVVLSVGAILMAFSLGSTGVVSKWMAFFLAGLGAIWGLAYFHFSIGEWMPYTSLALWLGTVGVLIFLAGRRASREPAPGGQGN